MIGSRKNQSNPGKYLYIWRKTCTGMWATGIIIYKKSQTLFLNQYHWKMSCSHIWIQKKHALPAAFLQGFVLHVLFCRNKTFFACLWMVLQLDCLKQVCAAAHFFTGENKSSRSPPSLQQFLVFSRLQYYNRRGIVISTPPPAITHKLAPLMEDGRGNWTEDWNDSLLLMDFPPKV